MKHAVIFDLDGTLLNTLGDLRAATNHALEVRGLPPHSMEEIRQFIGNGIRLLICRAMPEGTPEAEIDAVLDDFKAYYAAHIHDRTVPYDGIPQLLTALRKRGIQVAVLSNKIDSASQQLIEYFFPGKTDVVFGEHVGVPRKPDPTSCRMVMQQLGVQPEQVLYVGDSGTDMQTAKNAGLYAVGVTWGFRSKEVLLKYGADVLVHRPEQILQILDSDE
ncbi:HAD family hydrolase [Butyricicoccus intestinisimiae]|uniref:HAD-IIIA family hydrolase n=1 Tax=Butyricicoccus intestinisimiae TaxID=2841509 RepID=A0ABS6EQP9_9FIRM|nr:HAD-IIIA family hydrolase [Butyricicoccus intestinisimiae]MBU5489882.1 HAD-IIIA family hydrolase [Butyricicoccus intestinisimiae]